VPNEEYEKNYTLFAEEILSRNRKNDFHDDFIPFQRKVAHYGMINSLSQVILKIMSPGIPDFYQGTELWDFSLVDPDNRQPVDYELRKKLLAEIKSCTVNDNADLINSFTSGVKDGKIKLFTIYHSLKLRNGNSDLFEKGSYLKLEPKGEKRTNIFSFARNFEDKWIVVIVPRFSTELVNEYEFPVGEKVWKDTFVELPLHKRFKNIFTNEEFIEGNKICMSTAMRKFPGAVLKSV